MEVPRNPKAVRGHRKLQRLQKVLRRRRKLKRVLRRKKKRTRRKKPRRVVKISSDLALAMSRCWPRDSDRTLILGRVGEHPNFWGNLREPKKLSAKKMPDFGHQMIKAPLKTVADSCEGCV